jgi:hypothetical protein
MTGQVYFEIAEIAPLLGKSTEAARKQLVRAGAVRKIGSRWVMTRSKLIALYPEAFQKLARR